MFRVKIIKCSDSKLWYVDKVGEVYEVMNEAEAKVDAMKYEALFLDLEKTYPLKIDDTIKGILKEDCEIVMVEEKVDDDDGYVLTHGWYGCLTEFRNLKLPQTLQDKKILFIAASENHSKLLECFSKKVQSLHPGAKKWAAIDSAPNTVLGQNYRDGNEVIRLQLDISYIKIII